MSMTVRAGLQVASELAAFIEQVVLARGGRVYPPYPRGQQGRRGPPRDHGRPPQQAGEAGGRHAGPLRPRRAQAVAPAPAEYGTVLADLEWGLHWWMPGQVGVPMALRPCRQGSIDAFVVVGGEPSLAGARNPEALASGPLPPRPPRQASVGRPPQ